MGFDLMEWCDGNQNICIFVLVLVILQCSGYLTKILNMCGLEGFEVGDFSGDQKPCIGNSEITYGNYFLPMIPKLKNEVQDHKHIIPEDSKQDWVRGGLPTRQMVRNEDYLRRCQEKTFESN